MTSTYNKADGTNSPLTTPNSSNITGSSGHKNSIKGTKLARRARSFKDDLFEKISQMRTPTNTLGRSHSPHSPRNKHVKACTEDLKPTQSLEKHVRDIKNALKHFRDVVSKRKLEVVPGNGTVVLELIVGLYAALQPYTLNENSSTLISATTQVYLSLGKLIKLCDEVLLYEDENQCLSLSEENVKEVVELFENAVQNLVNIANEKIKEKDSGGTFTTTSNSPNTLCRPTIDVAGQRTSLPDIPLTPKERDILEKTCSNPIRTSHSTESILRDTSPPPKPPLPNRTINPPPLPPKRKNQHKQNNVAVESDFYPDSTLLGCGVDHLSSRSRSPDDNSSLLSASAGSLDSAFNQSREEEELKALTMDTSLEDQFLEDDVERMFAQTNQNSKKEINDKGIDVNALTGNVSKKYQRLSNESGFASMQSIRASMQSVSTKRSSEQSFQSQKSSSIASSTDLSSLRKIENISLNDTIINDLNNMDQKTIPNTIPTLVARQIISKQNQSISSTCSSSVNSIQQSITSSSLLSSHNINEQQHQQNSVITTSSCNFIKTTTNTENCITTSAGSVEAQNISSQIKLSSSPSEKMIDVNIKQNSVSSITKFDDNVDTVSEENAFKSPPPTSILSNNINTDEVFSGDIVPPALPIKTRNKSARKERHLSTYDNVEETDHAASSLSKDESVGIELRQHSAFYLQSKHQSLIEPRRFNAFGDSDKPPPLPMKKKHIIAYMEICSATSRSSAEQLRHSVHTYNLSQHHSPSEQFSPNRNISHSQTMNLSPIRKHLSSQSTPSSSPSSERPPALPPKKQQRINCKTPTIITTPPPSPKPTTYNSEYSRITLNHPNEMSTLSEEINETIEDEIKQNDNNLQEQKQDNNNLHQNQSLTDKNTNSLNVTSEEDEGIDVVLRNNSFSKQSISPSHSIKSENIPNLLEEIDISYYLVFKKEGEDGPDVKGGYLDGLIVHATKVQKNTDAFSEAFITTFRTFIVPLELIEKLTHRYTIFCCQVSDQKLKAAKETFSLLVRVVNDLTASDMTTHLLNLLIEFVYQLVCSGQLPMAKVLRNKIVEKVLLYKEYKTYTNNLMEEQRNIITNQPTLLDLKSIEIAEQMTLLDAELFRKIEIPEVLLFAKEQCEEKSPNLNKFTEHFNKMSYWARSQILKQDDAKDREKHVIKFIKIMKHLRKINNYNSYLALLSALDSAPIRRLEWHKTITEGLKEYCALIDSSSSFRIYRQALAETNPPCIPYIGLVLQDLTFVHVGNPDYLKDGIINFSKRWQQHNIIVNMKRFKRCSYPFKRNEKIIRFFENFENFFGEEQMWQISENIKPRGKKQAAQH